MLNNSRFKYSLIGLLFSANILVWTAASGQLPNDNLQVDFFDVGQGAAIFIEAPNKNQILIDGGPDETIVKKLGEVMPFYDRSIDLLILTHPDADHLTGLIEVVKRYQVGQIIETGVIDNSAAYQLWQQLIEEKKIPVIIAKAGEVVRIADDLNLDILYPQIDLQNKEVADMNSSSIVSRLVYGQNSFLFTGDAGQAVEWQLVSADINLHADVLNVAHHGSKSSTGDSFLAEVKPQIAVIQVGRNNRYGHPHQEVLQRLKNILILRTDINKDIKFKSDGKNISYY